jgi:hypothetical protein
MLLFSQKEKKNSRNSSDNNTKFYFVLQFHLKELYFQ